MQPATSTLCSSSSIDFSIFFPPSNILPIVSFATASNISNSGDSFPLLCTRRSLPSSSLTCRCDRIWKSPRDSDLQVTRSFPTCSIFFSIFVYRELQRRVSANYSFYSSEQTDTDFCTGYASSFYLLNLTVARASSESVEKTTEKRWWNGLSSVPLSLERETRHLEIRNELFTMRILADPAIVRLTTSNRRSAVFSTGYHSFLRLLARFTVALSSESRLEISPTFPFTILFPLGAVIFLRPSHISPSRVHARSASSNLLSFPCAREKLY